MSFLIYSHWQDVLKRIGTYELGGRCLIHQAWLQRGKPVNQGWHVNADDLIRLHSQGQESYDTMRLLSDFEPNAKRISLIEILDIFAFTYSEHDKVNWTPLMLRGRDVLNKDVQSMQEKEIEMEAIENPPYGKEDFVEFLYLQGDLGSWKWGRSGQTNAPFIQGEARNYFRRYF